MLIGQELSEIHLLMNFQDGGTPSWFLPKIGFWATATLMWPMSIRLPNLTQICSFETEMWGKHKIQEGGRCPILNSQQCYFALLIWPIWQSAPNLVQIGQYFADIYTSLCSFNMPPTAILNFIESWILQHSDPRMPMTIGWSNFTQTYISLFFIKISEVRHLGFVKI